MRLKSRKDSSTAFFFPTASAPSGRSEPAASFSIPVILSIAALAGACATGNSGAPASKDSGARRLAARELRVNPLERAVLSVSAPRVVDGSLVTLTLSFPPEQDPGDPALLSGSFGEVNFPFFPVGDGKTRRGYGAMVGVPLGYPPGEDRIFVHLSSSRGGRPEFTREQPFEVIEGQYRNEVLKVDPDKVVPPEWARERIEKEREELREIYGSLSPLDHLLSGFRLPVRSDVTSPFGSRRVYNGSLKSFHNGLDLRAAEGRRIYAAAPGRVALAKDLYYTGNTVVIDHGYGVFTLYGHLSTLGVRKGETLAKGMFVGNAGATGRVTGPHLHWGAIVHQVKVNPMELTKVVW